MEDGGPPCGIALSATGGLCADVTSHFTSRSHHTMEDCTLTSKANETKRNVIASVSDDAVMRKIHHLVDICLQFQ